MNELNSLRKLSNFILTVDLVTKCPIAMKTVFVIFALWQLRVFVMKQWSIISCFHHQLFLNIKSFPQAIEQLWELWIWFPQNIKKTQKKSNSFLRFVFLKLRNCSMNNNLWMLKSFNMFLLKYNCSHCFGCIVWESQ